MDGLLFQFEHLKGLHCVAIERGSMKLYLLNGGVALALYLLYPRKVISENLQKLDNSL